MHIKNNQKEFEEQPLAAADPVFEPFVLLDIALRIVTGSRSFCKIFGVSPENLKGRKLHEVIRGRRDNAALMEALNNVRLKNAEFEGIKFAIATENNNHLSIPLNITRIDDGDGLPLLIVLDVKDDSVVQMALEGESASAENSQEIFLLSIKHAPEAIFLMSRDAGFTYVNDQACTTLGYTREELLDLRLWEIDPLYSKEQWDSDWDNYQIDGPIATLKVESLHRRKDGSVFPVEVMAKHFCFGDSEFHVAFARNISDRKQAEQELKLTQSAIDRASIACFWMDARGHILYVNDQACRSLGYTREELLVKSGFDIDPDYTPDKCHTCFKQIRKDQAITFETTHQRKDGSEFPVEITANYVEFDGKEYSCIYARDITLVKRSEEERVRLEMQLRQAQKMESIGRLAGGVAHDFNNMLSVILGYTELIRQRMPREDPIYDDLLQIEKAANRSKETTRQLLAFSRKQVIEPRPVNLNKLIADAQNSLLRLIGEDIELSFIPQGDIWNINFDPSQVNQILVNLVVNARDAMPRGGRLRIGTKNVYLDEIYCREKAGLTPGQYVLLEVSDNGVGIDNDTLSYVFEPFFTTKNVDEGTGLGLATIYGIVKQNGGFIDVQSEEKVGTTFKIYLPKIMKPSLGDEKHLKSEVSASIGRILLVEDDKMVRKMTETMLSEIGYTVLVAETPLKALSVFEETGETIDLLMTDVVMPGMSGSELSQKVKVISPETKVLYMSGYTQDIIIQHGVLQDGVCFLQKPFTMSDLAQAILHVIGGQANIS